MSDSQDIRQRVMTVKQSFRLLMDGAVAQSMRDKGLGYRLNWGVTLPRLREMADKMGYDYDMAIALWKEPVRECQLLATMIMPPDVVLPGVIDVWMEQIPTVEVAEQAAFNLFQHLPYAAAKAYEWMASERELCQLCGFHVLSRLFMRGQEPNSRGINEYLDQAQVALQSPSPSVRKAALNSLGHFSDLGLVYQRLADSVLRQLAQS